MANTQLRPKNNLNLNIQMKNILRQKHRKDHNYDKDSASRSVIMIEMEAFRIEMQEDFEDLERLRQLKIKIKTKT